jgi:hypothetical protein
MLSDQRPQIRHDDRRTRDRRSVASVADAVAPPRLGLVRRGELLDQGVTADQIRGAREGGLLESVGPGVYRTVGSPASFRRDLIAACLAAGPEAVVSHRAALWMWRLTDLRPTPEITVPYRRSPRPRGVVLHRSTDLRHEHGIERRGVWVTRPARTLVDIGAVLPPRQVEAAVDQALVRNLITVPGLRSALDALGGRGRRGAGVLRTVLDHRALGDQRPESVLVPLMARLLRDHDGGRRFRPDFGFLRSTLLVEVDGLSVHGSRAALDADLERQNHLQRHGYLVLRYTATHLRRPAAVAREILAVARQRLV